MSQLYEATCSKCGHLSELLVRHEVPKDWICVKNAWICPSCQQCAGIRKSWPWKGYRCGKCKNFVVESAVNAHLAKCQPKGAECVKCKKLITDPDFVAHFKSCTGKPKEEPNPAINEGVEG